MKVEKYDIGLIVVGAVIGVVIVYLKTSNLLAGCLGIIPGSVGGALAAYISKKLK